MAMIRDGAGEVITPNNPLAVRAEASGIAQPTDVQAHYSESIMTHNAVVNPATAASAWIPCDKFEEISFHTSIAGTMRPDWSFDGVNAFSSDASISTVYGTVPVRAPFVRLVLTATGTVTAYAYLRA